MKVHTITGSGISGNIFLIDAEKPVLIDAGWSSDIDYAAAQVNDILGERKLAHIILTHRHIDHVGGALAFQDEFGGEMLAHEDDADSLIAGDAVSTGATMFGGDITFCRMFALSMETPSQAREIISSNDMLVRTPEASC